MRDVSSMVASNVPPISSLFINNQLEIFTGKGPFVHACVLSPFSRVRLCATLWTVARVSCRLLCPWDSPSKNTGVDGHAFLQGIFLTQGSNLHLSCLLHRQVGSSPLTPPEKPQVPYSQKCVFSSSHVWM